MRRYNTDEATLQAWKRKLLNVNGSEVLLTIIDSKDKAFMRRSFFYQERNQLLGEFETQDWFLTPVVNWFWSLMTFILPASWLTQSRPSLRELLEDDVDIEEFARLSMLKPAANSGQLIASDEDYENAVFANPQLALDDLQNRLSTLNKKSDIRNIIERLYAIKNHLTLDTYQTFLEILFKKYPLETLSFYYECYAEDMPDTGEPDEYIEHELMSRAMVDLFIFPLGIDPINQRLYALEELLLVLSLSLLKEPPLQNLLRAQIDKSPSPLKLASSLSLVFNKKGGAKQEIINRLPERVRQQGLKIPTYGNIQDCPFASPINLLQAVIENPDCFEGSSFYAQPLFIHLARLACQELLFHYHQQPQDKKNSQLLQMIEFLSEEILGTWQDAQHERTRFKTPFTPGECEAILNPSAVKSKGNSTFARATYYINILAVAVMFGLDSNLENNLLAKTRSIAAELQGDSEPFAPQELSWIRGAIERLNPKDSQLADKVIYILEKRIFYGPSNLNELPMPPRQSIDKLIVEMKENLNIASDAFAVFDEDSENIAINRVMTSFKGLLEQYEIKSISQLKVISKKIFKPLSQNYLTPELAKTWELELDNLQQRSLNGLVIPSPDDDAPHEHFFGSLVRQSKDLGEDQNRPNKP